MPMPKKPIRLWGRNNSINVQKVIWCLEELGVAYERIEAGGPHGVTDTPDYADLNPNRLVPVVRDGETTIWESNAILRYLFASYAPESGTGLHYPTDARVRAIEEQWMDWQATDFWPAMRPVFHGLIRQAPGVTDDIVAAAADATESKLSILNSQLEKTAFVAGKRFSMADIPVALTVARWLKLPVDHKRHEHIESWFDALRARKAFKPVDLPLT
ncbi:MAG: glutathione S-transferase family protein [Candidatus Phaeomarinobacter sp.]